MGAWIALFWYEGVDGNIRGNEPHPISLRLRVVLGSLKALTLSQYFFGMARWDSSHIVHEAHIQDQHGELQRIRAVRDCGATSIIISAQLLNRLGLPHEAAHITTHGLDSQVIVHGRESHKTVMTVHNMHHLAPVHELEVLVVPLMAYNLVLGLPWFKTPKPEINWATG